MSFICITEMSKVDRAMYDEITKKMGLDSPSSRWPDGLINHFAGAAEEGGWRIVEEWTTKDAFQRFCDSRPKDPKAMEAMGEMKQTWFEVYGAHHDEKMRESNLSKAA